MAAPTDPRVFRALVAAPSRQPPPHAHSRHCPAHGPVRIRSDEYYERRLDALTRTAGLSIAAMEREAAEDDNAGPRSAHQLSLATQLAEAREQLAEARERRRRLEGRLRDHQRRVLEQQKAAEAEKRRVSYVLCFC